MEGREGVRRRRQEILESLEEKEDAKEEEEEEEVMASAHHTEYDMLLQLSAGEVVELWLALAREPDGTADFAVVKRVILSRLAPEMAEQIYNAAHRAGALVHPGITPIREITAEGDELFVTQGLSRGECLSAFTEGTGRGALPVAVAIDVVAQAAAAVHAAHTALDAHGGLIGTVHAGLCPENVQISYDGTVTVSDFDWAGIALRASASGALVGALRYASPEQVLAGRIDARSDVYSLGVILWELLAGRQLVEGDDEFDIMETICEVSAPGPSHYNKGVPPFLDAILAKSLAKDPAKRLPDAARLEQSLRRVQQRLQASLSSTDLSRIMTKTFPGRARTWNVVAAMDLRTQAEEAARFLEPLWTGGPLVASDGGEDDSTAVYDATAIDRNPFADVIDEFQMTTDMAVVARVQEEPMVQLLNLQ